MGDMREKVAKAIEEKMDAQMADYGKCSFLETASAALEVCHFDELVAALKQAERKLSDMIAVHDDPMESRIVRMSRAVLAKVEASDA